MDGWDLTLHSNHATPRHVLLDEVGALPAPVRVRRLRKSCVLVCMAGHKNREGLFVRAPASAAAAILCGGEARAVSCLLEFDRCRSLSAGNPSEM